MAGPKPGNNENSVALTIPKKEKSRLAAGPSCCRLTGPELTAALALLIRFLALTVRILLLLAGLLAAALLPAGLAGLLARVLVLLARVLVLIGHRDLPG
jgi:hypothetical protein